MSLFLSPADGGPGPALHQSAGHPVSSGQAQHFHSHHRQPADDDTASDPRQPAAAATPSPARPQSAAAASSAAARAHSAPRSPRTAHYGEFQINWFFSERNRESRKLNQLKKKKNTTRFCSCSSSAGEAMSHSFSDISVLILLIFSCLWLWRALV